MTLLRDVASDSQHARWSEFVERYRPMMEAYLHERFPRVDADDMVQETLVALIKSMPAYRYVPEETGHFRNYLTGILRHRALHSIERAKYTAWRTPKRAPRPHNGDFKKISRRLLCGNCRSREGLP